MFISYIESHLFSSAGHYELRKSCCGFYSLVDDPLRRLALSFGLALLIFDAAVSTDSCKNS